jgi:hypothetical protein
VAAALGVEREERGLPLRRGRAGAFDHWGGVVGEFEREPPQLGRIGPPEKPSPVVVDRRSWVWVSSSNNQKSELVYSPSHISAGLQDTVIPIILAEYCLFFFTLEKT